jgi:sugar phosphate isomerase/epimerase
VADYHVHIPYDKITEHLQMIKSLRLNLEIYFNSKSLDSLKSSGSKLSLLKEQLDYNPLLTIHAPFMDLSPGAIDSKIREVTMERFNHVLDIAESLKVKSVVFHSGYEKWRYGFDINLWLEQSILTWQSIADMAGKVGVKIAIENIFEDEPSNLTLLMQKMGSKHFGICFDTGHFNIFSKVSLEEWMEALNPYIIQLHLHDNDKSFDQHKPIGDGTFDFDKFFSLLKNKNCIYTLEAHNAADAQKSIERLQKYL